MGQFWGGNGAVWGGNGAKWSAPLSPASSASRPGRPARLGRSGSIVREGGGGGARGVCHSWGWGRFRGNDDPPVGSRFRGNDVAPVDLWRRGYAPSPSRRHRHHRHCLEPDEVAVEGDVRRVLGRGRGARAFWIPAYAGMTVMGGGADGGVGVVGGRGVSSTLSRRVRGVLSPYRERGMRRWGAV